jgi:hypothetical protein
MSKKSRIAGSRRDKAARNFSAKASIFSIQRTGNGITIGLLEIGFRKIVFAGPSITGANNGSRKLTSTLTVSCC